MIYSDEKWLRLSELMFAFLIQEGAHNFFSFWDFTFKQFNNIITSKKLIILINFYHFRLSEQILLTKCAKEKCPL